MSIASIKARLEAATPGPWQVVEMEWAGGRVEYGVGPVDAEGIPTCTPLTEADAEFIAHARDDIPELLEMVARRSND